MSLGPFDLTGEPFLILYVVLLVTAIIAGIIIPRRMRPEGRRQAVSDPDQLAFLAGGKARFTDAVVARMLAAGSLVMATKTTRTASRVIGSAMVRLELVLGFILTFPRLMFSCDSRGVIHHGDDGGF